MYIYTPPVKHGSGDLRYGLLAAEPQRHTGDRRQRIPRRTVDPRDHGSIRRDTRREVILCLVVIAVCQIVDTEIQLDSRA